MKQTWTNNRERVTSFSFNNAERLLRMLICFFMFRSQNIRKKHVVRMSTEMIEGSGGGRLWQQSCWINCFNHNNSSKLSAHNLKFSLIIKADLLHGSRAFHCQRVPWSAKKGTLLKSSIQLEHWRKLTILWSCFWHFKHGLQYWRGAAAVENRILKYCWTTLLVQLY